MKKIHVGLAVLFCLNVMGMERGKKINWKQLIEEHKPKLSAHIQKVKSQVAAGSWVKSARDSCPDLLKGWLSKSIEAISGHSQENIDGIAFLDRFFKQEETRTNAIDIFINAQTQEQYQGQLNAICSVLTAFETLQEQTLQTLIPLMHQNTLEQLQQDKKLSQKELADLVCKTNTIKDEMYFRAVICNMMCTLLFSEVYETQ